MKSDEQVPAVPALSLSHGARTNTDLALKRRALTYEYLDADPAIGGRTRFFRAASVVTRVLGASGPTCFMRGLSASLEIANLARARQIRGGGLYTNGAFVANTADFIRFEQALVQQALDALWVEDAPRYAAEVGYVDRGLARMRLWCSCLRSGAHLRLHIALQQARRALGRQPQFARQVDRETIGLALASLPVRGSRRGAITVSSS
jgi:hypothetical protein